MNSEQLLLQLGISGAVLFVGFRIAMVLLKNWREAEGERTVAYAKAESERTAAFSAGFGSLSSKVDAHHMLDIKSHGELGEGIAEIKGALDEARWTRSSNLTPVEGVPHRKTPVGARSPRPGSHHDNDNDR